MKIKSVNAPNAPQPEGGYAQAIEITAPDRLLIISGQIPLDNKQNLPGTFGAQCQQVWANIQAQLHESGMGIENLIKVTTYLASRDHAEENGAIRQQILGDHTPALTVIITGIYDEDWLIEIEAMAAA